MKKEKDEKVGSISKKEEEEFLEMLKNSPGPKCSFDFEKEALRAINSI